MLNLLAPRMSPTPTSRRWRLLSCLTFPLAAALLADAVVFAAVHAATRRSRDSDTRDAIVRVQLGIRDIVVIITGAAGVVVVVFFLPRFGCRTGNRRRERNTSSRVVRAAAIRRAAVRHDDFLNSSRIMRGGSQAARRVRTGCECVARNGRRQRDAGGPVGVRVDMRAGS